MRDFPPVVRAYTVPDSALPSNTVPDTRSPARFLAWLIRQQWDVVVAEALVGIVWALPLTTGPWLFGKAVDEGIVAGVPRRTVLWVGILVGVTVLGALSGML